LPAFSIYLYLMRAFQAIQDTRTMFLVYLVENGVNILLAFALYPTFGVQGLAAALALAYAVGCVFALRIFHRRLGGLAGRRLGIILYRTTVAGVVSADVALAVSVLLAHLLGTSGGLTLLVRVLAAVATGVTVYLRVARYFGVDEVRSLLQLRRRTAA
jgi:putative peptidoglycan lipid II flippase